MRKIVTALVAFLAAVVGVVVWVQPAQATSCSTAMEHQAVPWDYDNYRARVRCSSVSSNTKVQGILYRTGVDKYTQWFTRQDATYYTGWYVWGTGSGYKTAPV